MGVNHPKICKYKLSIAQSVMTMMQKVDEEGALERESLRVVMFQEEVHAECG